MELMCGLYKVNICKVFKIGTSHNVLHGRIFFFLMFKVEGKNVFQRGSRMYRLPGPMLAHTNKAMQVVSKSSSILSGWASSLIGWSQSMFQL